MLRRRKIHIVVQKTMKITLPNFICQFKVFNIWYQCIMYMSVSHLIDPKSFDYQFLATLDERGQGIPKIGIKEGGERVTNVTRIITQLKDDSTMHSCGDNKNLPLLLSLKITHV